MNHFFNNLYHSAIDEPANRRYSQAQIPDLVAHANPRFSHLAESYRSSALLSIQSMITHFSYAAAAEPVGPAAGGNLGGRRSH